MKVWLKFCGMCRVSDFSLAVALGADAIGLICVPNTPRYVNDDDLRALAALPRGKSQLTLVFQNTPDPVVRERIAVAKPDLLQFHGEETPGFAESFGIPYIKATKNASQFPELALHNNAFAWLIDDPEYDVDLSVQPHAKPIIIAGQISLGNLRERIEKCRPFGVDVSRGIELEPRKKDTKLMTEFAHNLHKTFAT